MSQRHINAEPKQNPQSRFPLHKKVSIVSKKSSVSRASSKRKYAGDIEEFKKEGIDPKQLPQQEQPQSQRQLYNIQKSYKFIKDKEIERARGLVQALDLSSYFSQTYLDEIASQQASSQHNHNNANQLSSQRVQGVHDSKQPD